MNDEIKEILRRTDIDAVSFGVVVNYITNLQQENEKLKEDTIKWQDSWSIQTDKINKAIEYINNHPVDACHYLLNILQNGSDNE